MRVKIFKPKILKFLKSSVFFILCLSVLIAAPAIMLLNNDNDASANKAEQQVLTVWQIDCFEGGKGSRGTFLQNIGDDFSADGGCYINVISMSADAARLNLNNNVIPDLISYGAGIHGIESYIVGKTPYYTWCHGGYCILTIQSNADFSDVNSENTVINGGTGNLVGAAALLAGLNGGFVDKPTGAYVKLLNGEYKYLLGTQRDIFRLKTRGAAFSVKSLTDFNDLYQNISITTVDAKKKPYAENFIKYLTEHSDVSKLGLMSDGKKLYDDEMSIMEELEYTLKLVSPVNENVRKELESAVLNSDENKLKTLLK